MKNARPFLTALLISASLAATAMADLAEEFSSPPDAARPGVYWYFMDGNQDRDEMVADLRAMKAVGIGSVVFLEVDLGMERGPVPFMSEAWQDNVAHAFVEAGKLGMEVILGTGPGWAGSGGSWVDITDSMQHLVAGSVKVRGPGVFDDVLPVPPPHPANHFAGMTGEHSAARGQWFQDVAVLAYPAPAMAPAVIGEVEMKTLRDIKPYSIRHTNKLFVAPREDYPAADEAAVFDPARVIDLTALLGPDGRMRWEIPSGEWTILRFVARSTGQTTRPAPRTGHGFECDKFSAACYRRHWDHYQQKLLDRVIEEGGPLQKGKGVTTIHLDSWEMSSQNWSHGFREEFQKRRGYDPQPMSQAWMGYIVGDTERTERFLFDLRQTAQELVIEGHAGAIKRIAHEHGLLYSNEPYDMNPAGDIDLGSVADIPMCEFWNNPLDTEYSCIEAASIANTMGRRIVKAEAFTTAGEGFERTPANMKNQTDWAFAMGINGILFHTYQHQALGSREKPGMAMGPYGIQWHRNQTFWDQLSPYHEYITRCSHLLRQGVAVGDILYLTPEGAPHIFEPPADAITAGARLRDKKGHAFDAVTPRILALRASVEGDRIAFPGGTKYRVLVLPSLPTMTPGTLAVIDRLVKQGATVIGGPPVKSPSLVNHPACDHQVAALAGKLWNATTPPAAVTRIQYGKGAIYWGGQLAAGDGLYPSYTATARLLDSLGVAEDFSSSSGALRFIHRRTDAHDIYFISNRTGGTIETEGIFRVQGLHPQLWDPVTGEVRDLGQHESIGGRTRIPLSFAPFQSCFVVFPHQANSAGVQATPNSPAHETLANIDGAWSVAFDPAWGAPEKVTFDSLVAWTARPEDGIRHYSGTAVYRKSFDVELPPAEARGTARLWLDLGNVLDICEVRLNGKDLGILWTAPWRIDISDALRSHGNQLEIRVTNTWVNRLIGDQQHGNKGVRKVSWPSGLLGGRVRPAGRYTYVTHNHYKPDSRLQPAGLLGPVSIQQSR
jgi:hypothetical protein